jgi:hypothetical protein
MIWEFKKQEDLIKELTLNPSLGKRGETGFGYSCLVDL